MLPVISTKVTHMSHIELHDRQIPVDNEGFLLDPGDWDESVAEHIANSIELPLSAARWEIVRYVRDYFDTNQRIPETRTLLKELRSRHGKDVATRKYIYDLFPWGFGQQACKIAGMRKPLKLILDL